ncbi:MAG: hypothetical protein CVV21_08335 [Candidatus Goldiibacteriota bacterium HGW-Goldbacteria-1]|jgi:hypothetical protein|nr:MAG: hypothetical protein CVV21_08335 [Candidatus Goldiibacteriota bacterium HGW-Goldbacteria-1]
MKNNNTILAQKVPHGTQFIVNRKFRPSYIFKPGRTIKITIYKERIIGVYPVFLTDIMYFSAERHSIKKVITAAKTENNIEITVEHNSKQDVLADNLNISQAQLIISELKKNLPKSVFK